MWKKFKPLQDAFILTTIAFLIFLPITGMILKGFSLTFHFERPLILCGFVFFGRLFYLYFKETKFWMRFKDALTSRRSLHPIVSERARFQYHKIQFLIFAILLMLPFIVSTYWLTVLILALIYILLGLGLNIIVGLAGLLVLGFAAFYAIGAYGYALMAQYLGIHFWLALPLCMLMAGILGSLLGFPVLKMNGDYLAIVTLGFGEVVRLILENWASFTGGPNGVFVPTPTLFGIEFTHLTTTQHPIYFHELFHLPYSSKYKYIFIYLMLAFITVLIFKWVNRLQRLPIGRAWEALREDEIASRALGINHVTTKLSAFSIGAMIGALAGVFFAAFQGFVNPSSFTFIESAIVLSIVVLGGLGSTMGVVLAAIVLTLLPEVLREFAEYRMLLFGILMVWMMIVRPKGLVLLNRVKFEPPKGNP